MDFMEGGSLTDTLGTSVEFSEMYIAYVCREILLALAFMHHQFRLHRDIKSDNVLVSQAASQPRVFYLFQTFFFFFSVIFFLYRRPYQVCSITCAGMWTYTSALLYSSARFGLLRLGL